MLGSVVLLWLFFFLLFFLLRVRRPAGFPPGPSPLPVFGNLLQLNPTNPLKDMEKLSRRYGNIFSLYVGTRPVVVLNGVKAIREALVTRAAEFSGRPHHQLTSHITQNKGIIMADYGSSWRENRRFALTTLKNFGLGKSSTEERILEEVTHISAELESSDGSFLDPQVLFHLGVSNIICSLIFGNRFDYKDPFILTLITSMQELNTRLMGTWALIYELFPPLRILPLPFQRVFNIYRMLKEHAQKAVDEHKLSRVAGEPRDLLDSYLDQIEKTSDLDTTFDEAQMVILLLDLFIAGTDTTSNTLRCAMLFMMKHPDVQERCHREIEAVLEGRPYPSYEDRHAMPFVQAVIHETLRLADVLPLSVFHATSCDTQLQGYRVPQGTTVIPNLSSALREHGQWKFPQDFNPQNFLNDDGEFLKPDAFLPFSAGSRVCMGENLARMELFLTLVTLLRQFQFVWPKGSGPADFGLIYGGLQSPKPYNLGVCLRSRQHRLNNL